MEIESMLLFTGYASRLGPSDYNIEGQAFDRSRHLEDIIRNA